MSNEFYNASGAPSTGSTGSSATQRAEFLAIAAGFALLPTMLGHGNEFVVVNAGGTALTSANNVAAQTLLGLLIGTNVQAWDADLDALAALDATVGILIKTAANTYARRSVIGTANEVTVTNGNGAAGNITVSLPAALTFTGKTVNGGTFNNVTATGGTSNNVVVGNATVNNVTINAGTMNNVVETNSTFTNPASTTQALVDAATVAVAFASGGICTLLATGAVGNTRAMGAPSGIKQGGRYVVIYTQDATGNRALTWNAVYKSDSVNGIPPADPQPNAVTVFTYTSPDGVNLQLESRESMVLLASATASGSTSLDFTNLSGFDSFLFVLESIIPATSGSQLLIRISEDNGATYKAGAGNYRYSGQRIFGGSVSYIQSASNSAIVMTDASNNVTGTSFTVMGPNLSSGTTQKFFHWYGGGEMNDTNIWGITGVGSYTATANPVNGVRFNMNTGNLTSGTIKCYGLRG